MQIDWKAYDTQDLMTPLIIYSSITCIIPIGSQLISLVLYLSTLRQTMIQAKTYIYRRGLSRVTIISFRSWKIKCLALFVDIISISTVLIGFTLYLILYENLIYLKERFLFGYFFFLWQMLTSLVFVFRISCLFFPHIIGDIYYGWLQTRDKQLY